MGVNLADLLEQAGLTGRGGAAFPTAVKVRAALEHGADLVVNACDGELGAHKDGWVVATQLEGLREGARLLAGAGHRTRFAAHRGSVTALALTAAGLDVLGVPDRYVSSEETSLISLAHGGLARPMTKREPFVRGGRDSRGRPISPTVVLNAETVWRVAQIAERGAAWFRSHGTAQEPGPRLVSVTGSRGPVVVQTAPGVPLAEILAAAGGLPAETAALRIGGLGGVYVDAREIAHTRWSGPGLARLGTSMGPGVIAGVDPGLCPLRAVETDLRYAAGETAGQCGPCMFGLPALARDWSALVRHPDGETYERLRARTAQLPGRGACRFPDGVAGLVTSALRVFDDHLADHAADRCAHDRSCRALV